MFSSLYSPFFTSGLMSPLPQQHSFLSLDAQSLAPAPSTTSSRLRSRYSRDSIRSIPSPKPAPSITLPELPKSASTSSLAPPPSITISRSQAPAAITVLTRKPTSSTVSTRARRLNRSNALDRLEGKSKAPYTAPPSIAKFSVRRNFMSMSDDESDDDDSDIDSLSAKSDYSDYEEEADDDFFLDHPSVSSNSDNRLFYTGFMELEDHVLPTTASSTTSSPISPKSMSPRKPSAVRRLSTTVFPLKSFIDWTGDDAASSVNIPLSGAPSSPSSSPTSATPAAAWSWRSFIDVAGL